MNQSLNRLLTIILMVALTGTPFCFGVAIGHVNLTITTVSLLIGAVIVACSRFNNDMPIIPPRLFKEPAVLSTLVYFGIGILTGLVAADQGLYLKEIIQRTIIIWVPMYCTCVGVRTFDQGKMMFLSYLSSGLGLSFLSIASGLSSKFEKPVYIMGLHKNMTGGLCATLCVICIAYLMTSKRQFVTMGKIKVPARLLMLASLVIGLLAIIAAQGRASVVEVLTATFVMLICVRAKPSTLIKVGVACIGGVALVMKLLPEKAVEHVVSTQQHSANAVRIQLWTEMWDHFMHNPFLASGWGNPYYDQRGWCYYDLACVLLFDWMQMSIFGAIALLVMIYFSAKLGIDNSRRIQPHTLVSFVNCAATGVACGKFAHGMLDTFWIGRGQNLHTWMAVGTCLFVKLWLDQVNAKQVAPKATDDRKVLAKV